jgi:flagellin-like protein
MKKAITPLISTVLLIAFAIILGTLVMSWGNTTQFGPTDCETTQISITELNVNKQLCYADGKINAVIENNGNSNIKTVRVVILTPNNALSTDYEIGIKPGEFKRKAFGSEVNAANIQKIRIIPITNSKECVEKRIELEKIDNC